MTERWRLFNNVAPGWQLSLYTGWCSCTVGVDVERHRWETTVTLRVPFMHVVVEVWES